MLFWTVLIDIVLQRAGILAQVAHQNQDQPGCSEHLSSAFRQVHSFLHLHSRSLTTPSVSSFFTTNQFCIWWYVQKEWKEAVSLIGDNRTLLTFILAVDFRNSMQSYNALFHYVGYSLMINTWKQKHGGQVSVLLHNAPQICFSHQKRVELVSHPLIT